MRNPKWAHVFAGGALLFTATPLQAQDTEEPAVPKLQITAAEATKFETITLSEAVHRALLRNPNAQVAALEIERAGALLEEVRASSLPLLTANGTYTRLDADRTMPTQKPDGTPGPPRTIMSKSQLAANLNLSLPLLAPQRWVQWSQAAANLRTSEASSQDVRRTVALAVARAYLTVIAQKRAVDTNNRAVATDRAHFEYAHTRLVGGVGNRVDDVRAAQQLAADETLLASSYTALARAREALSVLVGQDQPVDVFDDVSLGTVSTDPEEAIAKRKDVAAAKARLNTAEKVKRESWTDYTPTLTGQFIPFYQNPSSFTTPETGWQALLVLNFPLFEGGLRRGQSHERSALVSEARAQYEALTRQTRSDIRLAVETIRRTEQALSAATRAANLAHEALSLSTLAYQAGATTNIEVIDAERRARDTDAAVVVAEDSLRQARLDLLAAAGQFP
jgi:outer membrane protein